MWLAVACRIALVCALVLLGTALCSLETELPGPREQLKPAKKPSPAFAGEVSAAQIRDVLELAREREQVLAAQSSIADWRKSLHKHGRTPGEEALVGETGVEQRPHRRRKKRAEHPGNEVYGKDGPGAVKPSGGKSNGTVALDGADPDDVDDAEASVVCYGPLGCFHETDHLPEMLPSSPAEVNTRFLVYTTTHRSEKPLIEFSYEELVVAGFGAAYWSNGTNDTVSIPVSSGMSSSLLKTFGDLSDRTVRVIVHGFGANCGLVWIYEMRTALMAVENCTVICVDWENGAKLPNYVRAAANTRLVGRQLALLLRLLRTHNGLRLSRVHLIGFSLGSHVAGFAGAEFSSASSALALRRPSGATAGNTEDDEEADDDGEEDESGADDGGVASESEQQGVPPEESAGLWRITGLDPAGPLFEAQPPEVRLDASDARYVDVIHSNGENLILGGLGSWQPMGTVDYYPNGGRVQHGCTNLFVGAVTDIIWAPPTTVEGRSLCNHRRAYKFFIDSVAPRCHFPAFPCESYDKFATGECFECGPGQGRNGTSSACGHMGYYATSREVGGYGQLYLRTRDEEPYCANQFRLRLRNAPDELPLRTVGRFKLTLEGGDTGNGIGDGGGDAGADEEGRGPVTLITFNETFHLDEAREDREFHAGQWLTTILVPHPALGHRPRALTITYRPYRGGWWQRSSVGKQLWRIGPILLTADDQKTYGACETLTLQADVPVRLELAQIQLTPRTAAARERSGHNLHDHADADNGDDDDDDDVGDCRVIEPNPARRPPKQPEIRATDGTSGARGGGPKSSIDELVQPGRHDHFSWTPVAISIPRQTHSDDGPQHQQPHVNEKRSFSASSALHATSDSSDGQPYQARDAAVNLPLERTLPGSSFASAGTTTTSTSSAIATGPDGGAQTVQLFPSRLVSFFERAERYARRTWDALFNSNVTASDTTDPSAMNSEASEIIISSSSITTTTTTTTTTTATTSASTSTIGAIHSSSVPRTADRKIAGYFASEEGTGTPPSSSSTEIRIALPTFRPLALTATEGSVGSGRQHYTRFIPLVYEEEKSQPAPARPLPSANVRKVFGEAAMA